MLDEVFLTSLGEDFNILSIILKLEFKTITNSRDKDANRN